MKRLFAIVAVLLFIQSGAFAQTPAPITASSFGVCKGDLLILSDATPGGTWSSSNPTIGYINPSTGALGGIAAGLVNITYTVGTSYVTQLVNVWPTPVIAPDTLRGCKGSTYYLNATPTGGGWTTTAPTVASVNYVGAVVGVGVGSAVISYTSATGCKTSIPVTINPVPLPITGAGFVYSGFSTTLTDVTPGGTWSSSDPALASVNATTGVVTGVSAGLVVISYSTPPVGCASTWRVEVNPLPGTTNLMAWYPFCGDTTDHSGLGHTLLNYTGTPAVDTIDRFNNSHNAYYFSGGNCIMEYSTFFPNNGIPPDYTYSCWINPRVAQSSIIMYNGNPNSDGFGFVMNDGVGFPGGAGTNVGVYFGGIGLFLSTPLPTPFNTWHNLVLVKSGNSYRFYIDDVSQGFFISPFNPMSVGSVFSLGGNASGVPLPNLGFDGFIDDVAVIEKQLSNAERLSLYFFNPDAKHFTLGPDTTVCSDNMELYPNFQTLGGAYTWKTLTTGLGYVTTDTTDTVVTVYPLPGPLGNSYSLTITKPFGCVASDTLTVYKSPIPVNLGLDRNFCLGDTVRLTSYFPGSKFLWSTGDTTHTLDVTATGNYFLRIDSVIHFTNSFGQPDSSVCVGRDTVYLHASTVPLVSLPPNVNNCLGNSITVHTVFDSGYTYLWSSGSTDDSTVITTSGIIWVRVTDTGCVRTDTMTATIIDERVTLLNPDTAICQGDRVTARSTVNPIVSYQWTPTAGMAVSNLPNVFIVPDTSAWYYLTVRYPGCPNLVDSFYIDVQPRPIVSIGGNRDVCEGDTIHVTAKTSPGWYKHNQFIWTPANPNLNVTDSSTVVFYAITRHDSEELIVKAYAPVYLTGAPQCYSIDSAAIFVHPKFRDSLAASYDFCPGDSMQLQPNLDVLANSLGVVVAAAKWSPGLYLDDSNVHYPWIHPITSQTYRLITYSQFGCRDTTHVDIIVHPAAVINLGDSVILSPGQSHQISPLTNCNTFLWYPPLGMDNVNISDPTVSPTVSTRYIVTASTEDGCKVVDSIKIHVDPGTLISMPNAFVPGGLTNGYFKVIKHGLVGLNYFRIFDRWGNKVFETKNIDEGWDGSFNGKPQPQGVYVYDVEAVTSTGTTFHREGNVTLLK